MFVRFVVESLCHPLNGVEIGVFQASYHLMRNQRMEPAEFAELRGCLDWFSEYLERPTRFCRSRRPHRDQVAICWYRDSAQRHLRQMWRMAGVLKRHGYPVKLLRTRRPGYIVYEDEFQIAAEPFTRELARASGRRV